MLESGSAAVIDRLRAAELAAMRRRAVRERGAPSEPVTDRDRNGRSET
jgi:hypothetical protein